MTTILLAAVSQRGLGIVLFASLAALTIMNYLVGERDVLYPGFIFCGTWTGVTAVYLLCPVEIDNLGWETVLIFLGGALCFTAGCIVGRRPLSGGGAGFRTASASHVGVRLLLLYSCVTLPFLVVATSKLAGQSVLSPDFLIASREAIQGSDTPSFGSRFLSLAQLVSVPAVWLVMIERERKVILWTSGILAAFTSVLGGTRGPLLQMICGCVVIGVMRSPIRRVSTVGKKIAAGAVALVLLMTVLSLILKKETRGADGVQVAVDMSAVYIAGPLAAFNYQVTHPVVFSEQPWNTLLPLVTPLVKSGVLHIALPPVHEEFVNVPFPFNVFTIYKPYYHDFGVAGCLIVLGVLGFAYGHIFRASVRGNKLALFLLAAFTESLVMSFFHDPFNYRLTVCLFTLSYGAFYFLVLRRLPHVRVGHVCKQRFNYSRAES